MTKIKVLLVGGPPGAGKTTLGRNLAIKLGWTSLTIDDLMTAGRALTSKETHPNLHIMNTGDSIGYFTDSSPQKLIEDAEIQHNANWIAVENVIRSHATNYGSPIVIDGWVLRPSRVEKLRLDVIRPYWINIEESVLEQRERKNVDFFGQSTDPEKMLRNFLKRSFWHNEFIKQEAKRYNQKILYQDGSVPVDTFCNLIIKDID